ncbi:hypothetical protein HU200_042158 [Digitaria exilis]|uniref:Uncharacterized protein n=1 Tax=Digitaria exilis TaxID=1010633 RepID=A0A835EHC9_9POAL|nr:hypothetical protein HU200_042158 [Digitaria exilis]
MQIIVSFLRHPASRADYVELLYPCMFGDYFFITLCELGEMGLLVSGNGEVEYQAPDYASSFCCDGSGLWACGSCSFKVQLVINETSRSISGWLCMYVVQQ